MATLQPSEGFPRVLRCQARPEFDILADKISRQSVKHFCRRIGMRSHPIAIGVAALAVFLCAETPATAQGTQRQRDACTPDVFRLCGAYIPDVDRITACLRGNGSRLSKACYDVFFPDPDALQPQPQYPPQYIDPRRRYPGPRPAPDDDED
jgi:hypothetical protein